MTRRVASSWRCTGLSLLLMALGYFIDILRSPTGSFGAVCSSSSSPIDSLHLDIAAMPATHVGMLLAPFVVVATDFSWGARNPVGALARTGELLLEMLAAEIVVLFLWAGTLSAGFMMVAMTGAMGAFAGAKSVAIAQCRSASEDGKPERALTGV